MDKGRAGRGGTERDGTNAGGDRNAGRYGGAGATGGCVLYHVLILSALLLVLLLSSCLFLQSTTIGRAWGGDNAGGTTYCLRPLQEVVFCYFLFSIFLFSFSHCSHFPNLSFFAKTNNRQAGAEPDRIKVVGDRNAGRDGGEGATSMCHVMFCSLLYSCLLLALLLFPIVHSTITGGAGQDITGPTLATQQRGTGQGTGGREGEVEGRAEEGSGGG